MVVTWPMPPGRLGVRRDPDCCRPGRWTSRGCGDRPNRARIAARRYVPTVPRSGSPTRGMATESASRFTICLTSGGRFIERPDGADVLAYGTTFPSGPVRVIFQDASYNPTKHERLRPRPHLALGQHPDLVTARPHGRSSSSGTGRLDRSECDPNRSAGLPVGDRDDWRGPYQVRPAASREEAPSGQWQPQ